MSDSDYDVDSPVPNDIEDEGLECEPFFAVGLGKKNPFTTFLHITSNPTKANVHTVECGVELSGKNTTNLINHLKKSINKKDYMKYLKDVSDKQETPSEKAKKKNLSKNEKHKQETLDQVIMLDLSKYRWNASNSCNCLFGISDGFEKAILFQQM